MADETKKKLSNLPRAVELDEGALFLVSSPDSSTETGYSSMTATPGAIAERLLGNTRYETELDTEAKTIFEAINEAAQTGGGGEAKDAVLYVPQALTEEQKAQARSNIGVSAGGTVDEVAREEIATVKADLTELANYQSSWHNVVNEYGLDNTGSTDISEAFKDIIKSIEVDAHGKGNTILYFPQGQYLFSNPIEFAEEDIKATITILGCETLIKGNAWTNYTQFIYSGGANTTMFFIPRSKIINFVGISFINSYDGIHNRNFETIVNPSISNGGNKVDKYTYTERVPNVNCINFYDGHNRTIAGCSFLNWSGCAVYAGTFSLINNCRFLECNLALWLPMDNYCEGNRIQNCKDGMRIGYRTEPTATTIRGGYNTVVNNRFDGIGRWGVLLVSDRNTFSNNVFDQIGYGCMVIGDYDDTFGLRSVSQTFGTVSDNSIIGNIFGRSCQEYADFEETETNKPLFKYMCTIFVNCNSYNNNFTGNVVAFQLNRLIDIGTSAELNARGSIFMFCFNAKIQANIFDVCGMLPSDLSFDNFDVLSNYRKIFQNIGTTTTTIKCRINGHDLFIRSISNNQTPKRFCVLDGLTDLETTNPSWTAPLYIGELAKFENNIYIGTGTASGNWFKLSNS